MNGNKRLLWIVGIGVVAFAMSLVAGAPVVGLFCLLLITPYIVEEVRKQKKAEKAAEKKRQQYNNSKIPSKQHAKNVVGTSQTEDNEKRDNKCSLDFAEIMTSQLVAMWISTGDGQFRDEYLRRIAICGLDKQITEEMFQYEMSILEKYPRLEMIDSRFIYKPMFDLKKCLLPHPLSYYETHFEYPLSYIVKVSDEAEWHYWNSHEKNLRDNVWEEIFELSDRNMKLFRPFAMNLVNNHGWTVENVNRFSSNEQGMLDLKRWGRKVSGASNDPWSIKSLGIEYRETQKKDESHPCIAFGFKEAKEAYEHMQYEIVEDYGDRAYDHYLYTWDDGHRMLARCKNCGGYILVQSSEFHSFTDSGDSYYTDYFPISSPEEADELNRKYDGFNIESKFEGRYLMRTNGTLSWSRELSED